MRELDFESFLNSDSNIISKTKAVRSRVTKAKLIERYFGTPLDFIVSNDEMMYNTLLRIKAEMKDPNGTVSNALRKYYQFVNDKMFPTLAEYRQ